MFKAYHRGFGGRGGDALGRIMREIELEYPALINGRAEVTSMDAGELAVKLSAEGRRASIAYLDPPYNQHQYGSNYHMLNTIARNDRPAVNREILVDGKKVAKGGIRKDWVDTRSDYCYRKSAADSFRQLVDSIDAERLLVSYSTEGIIPFREMLDILGAKGRLDYRCFRVHPVPGREAGAQYHAEQCRIRADFGYGKEKPAGGCGPDPADPQRGKNAPLSQAARKVPLYSLTGDLPWMLRMNSPESCFLYKDLGDDCRLRVGVCAFKRIASCTLAAQRKDAAAFRGGWRGPCGAC